MSNTDIIKGDKVNFQLVPHYIQTKCSGIYINPFHIILINSVTLFLEQIEDLD